jgi:hypothetical protein
MNKNEIQKKIASERKRQAKYLVQRPNTQRIIPPVETHWNQSLFQDKPFLLTEHDTYPKEYFIGIEEWKNLTGLIKEFGMEKIQEDLIFCYLNMVFAGATSEWKDNFHKELFEKEEEFVRLVDFMQEVSEDKLVLQSVTFVSKGFKAGGSVNTPPVLTIKGHIAMQTLEKVLGSYKSSTDAKTTEMVYEMQKGKARPDMTAGRKNQRKQKQHYYAVAIFNHMRKNLDIHPEGMGDWDKFIDYARQMKKKHPQRRRFLFIGKLMNMSGLLNNRESDDLALIDVIKKKLTPYLKNQKARTQRVGKNVTTK